MSLSLKVKLLFLVVAIPVGALFYFYPFEGGEDFEENRDCSLSESFQLSREVPSPILKLKDLEASEFCDYLQCRDRYQFQLEEYVKIFGLDAHENNYDTNYGNLAIGTQGDLITDIMYSFPSTKNKALCSGEIDLVRSLLMGLNPQGNVEAVIDDVISGMYQEEKRNEVLNYDWGSYVLQPRKNLDGFSLYVVSQERFAKYQERRAQ